MDANVLQQHKENITPLPVGRSASKLGKALGESRSRTSLASQRELLEAKLLSDELDDPLQEYVNYIEWIHNHYPQGANAESGLLGVLERCTSFFRDADHYKNDPRYLKVWLEYAAYSDSPRDVFVYLAKKRIGCELALYYEEFARFLEVRHAYTDAQEVYEVGMERNARPFARLQRSLAAFTKRTQSQTTSSSGASKELQPTRNAPSSGLRQILGKRTAEEAAEEMVERVTDRVANRDMRNASEARSNNHSVHFGGIGGSLKKRVTVYGDPSRVSIKDEVFKSDESAVLAPLGAGTENKIAARPWNGEVLKQKLGHEKKAAKFSVFKDTEEASDSATQQTAFELVLENNHNYTVIRNPGKPPERLAVNLNLLYASSGEETCLAELLGSLSKRETDEQTDKARERHATERRTTERHDVIERATERATEREPNFERVEKRPLEMRVSKQIGTRDQEIKDDRNLNLRNENSKSEKLGNSKSKDSLGFGHESDGVPRSSNRGSKAQDPEGDHTFTIPLRDGNTTQMAKSPTMTLFSRLTTNEVLGMFKDAAHNFQSDDESMRVTEEFTNYDGFVTETIHAEPEQAATPPTDHYDSGSSPFLERP